VPNSIDYDESFQFDQLNERDPEDNIPPPDTLHYFRVFVTRRKLMYPGVKEISVYLIKAMNSKQAYDLAKETVKDRGFNTESLWVEQVELPIYNQVVQIWKSEMKS
jgi:hypothetical protein